MRGRADAADDQDRHGEGALAESRVVSVVMKRSHLLLAAIAIGISPFSAVALAANEYEYQPPKPCTPDKQYCVDIVEQKLPGAPESEDRTLILQHKGRVLARYPTFGYVLNIYWSPHLRYVALNNRRANSGDWLWVISLADGKVIKMPRDLAEELHKERLGLPNIDDAGLGEITKKFSQCAGDGIHHEYLVATSWQSDNELRVLCEVTCFHFDDFIDAGNVYLIRGGRMIRQSRTIETRTESVHD